MKLLTVCTVFSKRFSVFNNAKRMASGYLVDEPKYSFLKELGIKSTNAGVFDGQKWSGTGPVSCEIFIKNVLLIYYKCKKRIV